ncbi:glutamate racemase [Gilvimarinus sp. SDUM040013]|uniref:Glutamate racemase n=1 Tax=Gilvimarinus gilvus TaxID=3058038 RepID=A0ABU4S2X8_9GAMM|nr:glutamate racemase [Gilvimarinus sp. SDUM040013]MDO3384985.1 glutamate racemase [Gilvimarinus sp. SDUM040013]MDX6851506.1 glutamate racemase [Gilvimarinus sp. SDUM040013]
MTKSANSPQVLLFDSGVGGLTIAREIRLLCPNVTLNYLSDNAGFPYGNKSSDFVVSRCLTLVKYMVEQVNPKLTLVIIACNTASTLALPALREQIGVPIIGVVPAIKPAAALSSNQYFGLLATPATVRRAYTQKLIRDFAANCTVVPVGSASLVQLAESKLQGKAVDLDQLRSILNPFVRLSKQNPTPEKLDTLVLACTHFPLLRDEISEVLERPINVIDSGLAIAKRTLSLLPGPDTEKPELGIYWTTEPAQTAPQPPDWIGNGYFSAGEIISAI